MGGGAGIGFEVKLESIALKWTGEKWEVSGPVEIDSWRAEDYMNALGNIRPDLLKIVSVDITESDPDPEYAKRAHEIHGEFVHTDTGKVEGSMFSGYTRGKWEDRFPLELTGRLHIQYYGDVDITLTVKPRNKRQFGAFYNALFEGYMKAPDMSSWEHARVTRWYENQYDRLEEKYTVEG